MVQGQTADRFFNFDKGDISRHLAHSANNLILDQGKVKSKQ